MVSLSGSMLFPATLPHGTTRSTRFSIWSADTITSLCYKPRKEQRKVACMVPLRNIDSYEYPATKFNDSYKPEQFWMVMEPEDDSDVLIECKNVYKSFGEKDILRGVSFKIRHGEALGIIGPSGTGKSTILKIIAGLLAPDKGEVYIRGRKREGLAKRGVRVVIPARDLKKAAEVKKVIQKETPKAEIIIFETDLSCFASVKKFSSDFLALGLPLNILINNAGVFSQNLEFSEDKIEMTFATNCLGHFLLTELVLEKMIETAAEIGIQGRIINLSSVIHSWVKRDSFCFNQMINPNPKNYNGTRAYAQSKLANILHAKEMARQLKARNARVTINAVHPGIVKTGIIRAHKSFITDSLYFIASKLLKSTSQGASTTCYVALSPQTEGVSGKYFADCNESSCSALACDESEAHELLRQTTPLIYRSLYQQPPA